MYIEIIKFLMQSLNLTESQQEKVFQLMEVCGVEVNAAIGLLKKHNFDLERAIQGHFNPGAAVQPSHPPAANYAPDPAMYEQDFPMDQEFPGGGGDYDSEEEDEDEEYIRYRNYRRTGMTFEAKYGAHKEGVGAKIKGWMPSFLRSQQPGGETFLNRLNEAYGNINQIKFQKGTFMQNIEHIAKEKFPLLVFFLKFDEPTKNTVVKMITNESFAHSVSTCFRCLGLDVRTYEFEKELSKYVDRNKDCPCLAIFRVDICDQIHLMEKIKIELTSDIKEIHKKLQYFKSMCIRAELNEAIYEKRYHAKMNGQYVKPMLTFEQRQKLNQQKQLKKQQDQEFKLTNQLLQQKKKQENTQAVKQKEVQKKGVAATQRRKKVRQSLPQYSTGVNFKFRLPSGSSIIKTISPKQLVNFLYVFIQSLQQAGFQNDVERKFEIIRPYDRLNLNDSKNKTVHQVFGQDGSENLVVNEI